MSASTAPAAPVSPKATLGLTGLTSNAMALIAPGAFLWLTYAMQSLYGAPAAGMSMWFGIMLAVALCLATAISYAELSKLYPGAGSSYFFAEQAFLSKRQGFKWARISKFMVGWASHLYYWVYPGVMVGVTALIAGYMLGQLDSHFFSTVHFSAAIPSPLFMIGFCVVFSFGVAYVAFRGVGGTTGVNAAINVVQITALVIFSIMAIAHRVEHAEGSACWTMDSTGTPTQYVQDTVPAMIADPKDATKQIVDPSGATTPKVDDKGNAVFVMENGKPKPFTISYQNGITTANDPTTGKPVTTFSHHGSAASVIAPHGVQYMFIQACVAILILVGFESVTAMGEEARNAKRDIPIAVILSLVIQGCICYALEYFAANYYIGSQYTNTQASGSIAPIGDMMQLVGAWAFGSAKAGWWFMMAQATTVFLALIGTTLSCMSTAARVTYAMGRDKEVPDAFGFLHGKKQTPHTAIWTLAVLSALIGIVAVVLNFCGPAAQADSATQPLKDMHSIWYSFGLISHDTAAKIPQGLLVVTLVSNFGTFLLYMMSCLVAIVAFHEHHLHSFWKHKAVPMFGLLANLACMLFYIVGPFSVPGMSKTEPFVALGVAALWGLYGVIFFVARSKRSGRPILLTAPLAAV